MSWFCDSRFAQTQSGNGFCRGGFSQVAFEETLASVLAADGRQTMQKNVRRNEKGAAEFLRSASLGDLS
jgi:hypothetical protein